MLTPRQTTASVPANAPHEALSSRMGRIFDSLVELNKTFGILRSEMFGEGESIAPCERGERDKLSLDQMVNATEYQVQIAHEQLSSVLNRL
jgi:hypothetical protein